MKNKIIILLGMIFIIGMISIVNADLYQSQYTLVDSIHSMVDIRGYYYVDDTNTDNISTGTPVNVLYSVNVDSLPYQTIDYCNLTIADTHFYQWRIVNTTNYTTYNFRNYNSVLPASDTFSFSLYGNDILQTDFYCHYGNLSKYLINGYTGGNAELLSSSFACSECSNYDYGEILNSSQNYNAYVNYDRIQTVMSWNWEGWLIVEWIVRILFIFIAIGLIFAGVYWIYVFIKNLENDISKK